MTGIWTDPMRTVRSTSKERARGQKSWRKRDPTWRKSDEICEKVNFVGEKKYMLCLYWCVGGAGLTQDAAAPGAGHGISGGREVRYAAEKETPLGEKETPLGEKAVKVGEKVNFVGEKKYMLFISAGATP